MASYRKRGVSWYVEVRRAGIHTSATFSTKAEAQAWAATTEAGILSGKRGDVPNKTFGDLLSRYAEEVSPTKRGERWERLRIGLTQRDAISCVTLRELDARHVAEWRDRRLAQVSPASVRREWNLLSNACTVAVKEWKWLTDNPMREVKRPAPTDARDRISTDDEIERLLFALGYSREDALLRISARVGAAVLFAIETAMRAGEISALTYNDVDITRRTAKVRGGKTSAAKRDVPLSPEAIRIIEQLPAGADTLFNVTTTQLDALFRKAKAKAMVTDLHFHDLRATAITRLAGKLDILSLARMVGHRDLRMLQIYFRESAEETAKKLG